MRKREKSLIKNEEISGWEKKEKIMKTLFFIEEISVNNSNNISTCVIKQ
jgi:hypothetical protein